MLFFFTLCLIHISNMITVDHVNPTIKCVNEKIYCFIQMMTIVMVTRNVVGKFNFCKHSVFRYSEDFLPFRYTALAFFAQLFRMAVLNGFQTCIWWVTRRQNSSLANQCVSHVFLIMLMPLLMGIFSLRVSQTQESVFLRSNEIKKYNRNVYFLVKYA